MHNSKKVIISVFGIMMSVIFISLIVIAPYMNSEFYYYQDKNLRDSLAGTINCIAIGDSHALVGIDTKILDEKLGCNSYNLSSSMMNLDNRYYMLSKELARNPVKTVIIELSYDTLTRDECNEYAMGDEPTVARLDSFFERIHYMIRYTPINDWLNLYSREFVSGLDYYKEMLLHHRMNNVDYSAKGFAPKRVSDVTLSKEKAEEIHNTRIIDADWAEKNIKKFDKVIELCHSYDCRFVFAVVPVSNALIWQYDGCDSFYNRLVDYAENNNCEVYDINISKDRNRLFTDDKSFADSDHLSYIGAATNTELLTQAMRDKDSANAKVFFYSSYNEMKSESEYAE